MVIGALLGLGAIWLLTTVINAAGYLLEIGEQVTVTVAEEGYDGSSDFGAGYYDDDGERVEVRLADVDDREKINTRLPLIPLDFGPGVILHNDRGTAADDLMNLIGFGMFSLLALSLMFGGWRAYKGKPPARLPFKTRSAKASA